MTVNYNAKIVLNGLQIFFDPANPNSYIQNKNLLSSSTALITNWSTNLSPVRIANYDVAPDGTKTATRMDTNASYTGVFQYINLYANNTYTYSVYVKYVSGNPEIWFGKDSGTVATIKFNLFTGVVALNTGSPFNINATSVGDGWYRISFSLNMTVSSTSSVILYGASSSNSSFLVWGAQVEKSSSVTSYSATASSNTSWVDLISKKNATLSSDFKNIDGFMPYNGTNSSASFDISGINFSTEQTIIMGIMSNENDSNRRNPYDHEYGGYGTITQETNGAFSYFHGPLGGQNGDYNTAISSFTLAQNEKSIITVSRGSQYTKWYKNGILSNQDTNFRSVAGTSTSTARIGHGYAGPPYSGNIYFLMIYNIQLSDAEVLQNYNALRGRCGI